jgi:soluble lytic murein transglycosylase-like protein
VYQRSMILVSLFLLIIPCSSSAFRVQGFDRDANPIISDGRTKAFSPKPFLGLIDRVAKTVGLAPELLYAVIEAESRWNPHAVSSQGALGLMQLMPSTAKQFHVVNPFDPADNVMGGARYLKYLSHLFNNDLGMMLSAYHCGHSRMRLPGSSVPKTGVTAEYVRKVLTTYYLESSRRRSDSKITKNF